VDYHVESDSPWQWGALADRLTESPQGQALCVLNTRRHAREVWEALRERVPDPDAVIHLSSAMCAEHRIDVLGRPENPEPGSVRFRLHPDRRMPCLLVSTQVIEAGVDVDFPRVFRALGPLDSIVQAAGRCNREGGLRDSAGNPVRGQVVVFRPADEAMPPGLYQLATGRAYTYLTEHTGEQLATDPEIFARYFRELYGSADCDAHDIQGRRTRFQVREVSALARVISDGGTPVIVHYGESPGLIARIRAEGTFDRTMIRRLQRFTVNLRERDRAELNQAGMIEPLLPASPDGPHVLHAGAYHRQLGVVIAGRPAEDFII
jgi:CRISPR-associated endonuclease/helicase Cas3